MPEHTPADGANTPPFKNEMRQRREFLLAAQQLMQRIDQIEDGLERFQNADLPGFTAWHQERFHKEKAEIKALEQELAQLVQFHNSLVALAKMYHLKMPEAFRRLRDEENAYREGSPARRRKIDAERITREHFLRMDQDEAAHPGLANERDSDADAATRAREVHEHAPGAPSAATPLHPPDSQVPTPPDETSTVDAERIKLVYRKLVRRLHPDVQGPQIEPSEARWQQRIWHLSQQAKQAGNAKFLECIYNVCLVRQMELSELSLSDAREVHAWFSHQTSELEHRLAQARQQRAWGFSALSDLYEIKCQVLADFEQERRFLQNEIADLQGQHALLEVLAFSGTSSPTALKPPPPRKRSFRHKPRTPEQLSLFEVGANISENP